jgi:hypothetical protein
MSDKDRALLDERIKRTKAKPAAVVTAMPPEVRQEARSRTADEPIAKRDASPATRVPSAPATSRRSQGLFKIDLQAVGDSR